MKYKLAEDREKMCNLGEGIYEQGVPDGERRDERRGRAEGGRQQRLADAEGIMLRECQLMRLPECRRLLQMRLNRCLVCSPDDLGCLI